MLVKIDKPQSIHAKAVELCNSPEPVELETSARLFNLYKPFATTLKDKIELSKQINHIYVKLLINENETTEKLQIFMRAIAEQVYILKLSDQGHKDANLENEYSTNITALFEVLESHKMEGYEKLLTADFRDTILSRYGNSELLSFLENNPNKSTNILYNRFSKEDLIYQRTMDLINSCFQKLHKEEEKEEGKEDEDDEPVPELDCTFSELNFGNDYEDDYYFETVKHIEEIEEKGLISFVRYLLETYDVKVDGVVIKTLSNDAIEIKKDKVFKFFKRTKFYTRIENDITGFIIKVIDRNGWYDENNVECDY